MALPLPPPPHRSLSRRCSSSWRCLFYCLIDRVCLVPDSSPSSTELPLPPPHRSLSRRCSSSRRCLFCHRIALRMPLLLRSPQLLDLDIRTCTRESREDIEKYKLGSLKTFHYLNQSNCYELDGVNDAHEYLATRRAMEIVGINEEEQEAIFRVVAAVLHLVPKGRK